MTLIDEHLAAKLGVTPQSRAFVLFAPPGYAQNYPTIQLKRSPAHVPGQVDWVQAFYVLRAGAAESMAVLATRLSSSGSLWVSWPKRSSGIRSDLTDQVVREIGLQVGLVDVKVASIDASWSALKFVRRIKDR